jgi:hypothetical protein
MVEEGAEMLEELQANLSQLENDIEESWRYL